MTKKLVDENGEILAETGQKVYGLVELKPKQRSGGFFVAIQDGFFYLAQSNLTQEQWRVLMYLFSKLDFDNYIQVSQTEIAKALGMQKQNVNRAIKVLVEKKIIHKGPKVGTSWTYILDTSFGFKGTKAAENRLTKALMEAKKRGLRVIEGEKE